MKKKGIRGFTITELLVLVSILCVVSVIVLPDLVRAGDTEREAEVKSNIHAIQIALERYAVDTGGFYPYMLYGGDRTDTFVRWGGSIDPETGISFYYPPDEPDYIPFPGDCDALIQFGYLSHYPENPFKADSDNLSGLRIKTNPAENGFGPLEYHMNTSGRTRTNIWAMPYDRGTHYVRRLVGGESGDLMWEISEGQRHAPWPVVIVPGPEPNWNGYSNPVLSDYDWEYAGEYNQSRQFWLTPGNFYYYAIFEGVAGYSTFVSSAGGPDPSSYLTGWVIGYRLCGYGAPTNTGDDVYNLWGDFGERSLMSVNNPTAAFSGPEGFYVGPDGRPDGVIIMVNSGVD